MVRRVKAKRSKKKSRTIKELEAENEFQDIVIQELIEKKHPKILVIDADNYVNRSIARMFLERHRLAKKRKVDYVV